MTHELPPKFEKRMTDEISKGQESCHISLSEVYTRTFTKGFLAGFSARDEQVERLVKALNYYKNLGDNSNCDIELALEKAMELRPHNPITINLGGKILAEVAGKALAEHSAEMKGGGVRMDIKLFTTTEQKEVLTFIEETRVACSTTSQRVFLILSYFVASSFFYWRWIMLAYLLHLGWSLCK